MLKERIMKDLAELCVKIGERPVGSERNRMATRYAAERLAASGFSVTEPGFTCVDWEFGGLDLVLGEEQIRAFAGPYTPACDIKSSFKTAATIDELADQDLTGEILVLHGQLCKEQLSPKNFVFYNPDHHKRIIGLLERKAPLAVVAVTGRQPEVVGAVSPFPLI